MKLTLLEQDLLAELKLAYRMLLQTDWPHGDEAMEAITQAIANAEKQEAR